MVSERRDDTGDVVGGMFKSLEITMVAGKICAMCRDLNLDQMKAMIKKQEKMYSKENIDWPADIKELGNDFHAILKLLLPLAEEAQRIHEARKDK